MTYWNRNGARKWSRDSQMWGQEWGLLFHEHRICVWQFLGIDLNSCPYATESYIWKWLRYYHAFLHILPQLAKKWQLCLIPELPAFGSWNRKVFNGRSYKTKNNVLASGQHLITKYFTSELFSTFQNNQELLICLCSLGCHPRWVFLIVSIATLRLPTPL